MTKYKTDFCHTLITPIEYASGGNALKAARLFVKAPSNTQLDDLAELEQDSNSALFNVAMRMKDMQKKEGAEPIPTVDSSTKITDEDAEKHIVLLSANGLKLSKAYSRLKNIICFHSNAALIDSKEKMTETLFEQMDPNDTRVLLGKYLLNFINISLPN